MVLSLAIVLIPQVSMAAGVFLYVTKTQDCNCPGLQVEQDFESTVGSFEDIDRSIESLTLT